MMPDKSYRLKNTSQEFLHLLHFVEEGHSVELTQDDRTVAILVSATEYRSFHPAPQGDFWQALQRFRKQYATDFVEVDEVFADVRDSHSGREVVL